MKRNKPSSYHYGEKRSYGIKRAWYFFSDLSKAAGHDNLDFIQVFESYDDYWSSGNVEADLERARLIEDWFDMGSKVLDVGIGDGTISEYLMKNRNLEIFGLDISEIACEKARKRGVRVEARDITNGIGLKANEFYDYILLSEILEHTIYPQKILIDSVLHAKKGVVVTIPNTAFIKWRIHLLRGYFPRQSFTHLHFWSIKDFELFCKALNVEILGFRTFLPRYLFRFKNLLGVQQAWLLAPRHNPRTYNPS